MKTQSRIRQNALSAIAFSQSYKTKENYFTEVLRTVEYFRKQSKFIPADTIEMLRHVEAGMVLFDHDDSLPHVFTCIDATDRVHLRDSGFALLYSIDCDIHALTTELNLCQKLRASSAQTARHDRPCTARDGQFVQSKFLLESSQEMPNTALPINN